MATTNSGGLVDPKFQGALGSEEIKANLQDEINRVQTDLGSYRNRRMQGAAWLAPYGNLAQSLALSDEQQNKKYSDLFNMRQTLAQANLMDSRKGQISNLFQGFDPNTAASLSALYQQNPEEALKKAADIRGENVKLTNTQKENAAAGLTPEDVYRKTLCSDFDLGLYGKKKAIDLTGQAGLEQLKSEFDLNKNIQIKTLEAALKKEGTGSEITKSLALDSAKKTIKTAENADRALPAINQNIEILKNNPDFGGGLGMDTLTSLATLPGASAVLAKLSPAQAKAVEDYRQYKSNIESQVIPIAKDLGTNPSNTDASRLEQSIGGLSVPRKVMISNTAKLAALSEMKQKQRDEILAAEGNPKAILDITKKYSGDAVFNEYYKKYLEEMVPNIGGSMGNSESKSESGSKPSNTNRKPLSAFGS